MKLIANLQNIELLIETEDVVEEIEVECYHAIDSDDPNDLYPQQPWAW